MLTAKTEYACLALLQLAAEHASARPVTAGCLATTACIPEGFLVQILQQLKQVGLVTSTRGKSGGYRLARSPAQITLGETLDLLEGTFTPGRSNLAEPTPLAGVLTGVCEEANLAARERLHGITLAELVEQGATASAPMYHI